MHGSSIFNIRIDFDKSHDSYIYDKKRNRYFLDFFGLYSTLPLGYSHEIFEDKSFWETLNKIARVKVTNCEIISDEGESLVRTFSRHSDMKGFEYFYFCCTGALAIEAAIKTAIDYKGSDKPIVISLKESFHGINSYGGFVTDRFFPVSQRLNGLPILDWCIKIHNPKFIYRNNSIDAEATQAGLEQFKTEFNACLEKHGADNIAALLVEPIQATYGDNYFPESFFKLIRELCDKHNICLVFDEIQCGFGVTGKMWYFQHLGMEPDIVAFGKKSQTSGIMVKERFGKIFKTPIRLEVTWDSDLIDLVRCEYVLRAYGRYNILENTRKRGGELLEGLREIKSLRNVRGLGMLVAFDFETSQEQDSFAGKAFENGLLFNKTRDKTIRLRPNLNVSSAEVQEALGIISKSV